MPSDPRSSAELKLPFIFVPHGEPEPTEWLASHRDCIKLPATLQPDAHGDGGANPWSGSPPYGSPPRGSPSSGQRRATDGHAAPPDPAAPWPPTGSAMSDPMSAGPNQTPDGAGISDDPIAAFRRANDALVTTASAYASGRGAGADVPTGAAVASDATSAERTPTDAGQAEDPTVPAAQGAGPHVYVAGNPRQWIGPAQVGDGECVTLVEKATGAPGDKDWRRGALVQGNTQLAPGTAIALFDTNGPYGNHTDGTSHAAIYLRQDAEGIYVIDQWNIRSHGKIVARQAPHERRIRFNPPNRAAVDHGELYHVIQ